MRYSLLTPEEARCILLNARRIASAQAKRGVWWGFASDVFGVGSTNARHLCRRAGIDPDSRVTAEPVRRERLPQELQAA